MPAARDVNDLPQVFSSNVKEISGRVHQRLKMIKSLDWFRENDRYPVFDWKVRDNQAVNLESSQQLAYAVDVITIKVRKNQHINLGVRAKFSGQPINLSGQAVWRI